MGKKLKIRAKLNIAFAAILLLVILSSVLQTMSTADVSREYETVIDEFEAAQIELTELKAEYLKAQNQVLKMTDSKERAQEEYAALQETITEISGNIDGYIKSLQEMITESSLQDELAELEEMMSEEREEVQAIMKLIQAGQLRQAQERYTDEFSDSLEEGNETIDEILAECKDLSQKNREDAQEYRTTSVWFSIGFSIVLVILIIIIATVVVYTICRPLKDLVVAVGRLSTGDLNVEIQKKNDDEIGEVADALSALVEKDRRAAKIAKDVSNGDLSMIVKPESDADVLGLAFKYLVDENNKTLTNIRISANQVNTGSSQVASASQSLAQGSTEQASAIEQVTASINDITTKTGNNAENATKANELIQGTRENAKEGQMQMSNMVEAMKEINTASENISKIMKTIDDIAFQTNILALNAAVEAARAGDHGKGFAVVAEEVRSLAEKCAEAANETADMIDDSMQKVRNGSDLASKTAVRLTDIVGDVENTVVLIQEIAEASNDQAIALKQIEQAINQLTKVVQTNSATSEECAAASEQLSGQAKNLEILVEKYKLRNLTGQQSFIEPAGLPASEFQYTGGQDNFGQNTFTEMSGQIPDASDFTDLTNEVENEQIISLEDNTYSKY